MSAMVTLQTSAARYQAVPSIASPRTVPSQPQDREKELSRVLEERLTGQLARIRQRIQPERGSGPQSPDGVGSILDVRA